MLRRDFLRTVAAALGVACVPLAVKAKAAVTPVIPFEPKSFLTYNGVEMALMRGHIKQVTIGHKRCIRLHAEGVLLDCDPLSDEIRDKLLDSRADAILKDEFHRTVLEFHGNRHNVQPQSLTTTRFCGELWLTTVDIDIKER